MNNLDEIANICHELLFSAEEAYLYKQYIDSRLSIDYQNIYKIGYFPPSKQIHLFNNSSAKELLIKNKLAYEKYINEIPIRKEFKTLLEDHNLVIPYYDVYGNCVALAGRTILEDYKNHNISKYKNTFFSKTKHIFNLNLAKNYILKENYVIIVEGQLDVIKANENGIFNIVAVGSANLTEDQVALLLRYTNNFIIIFDNDKAGTDGINRAKELFNNHANIKTFTFTDYKDIDQYFVNGGAKDNLLEMIKK